MASAQGHILMNEYLEQARNYYASLTPIDKAKYRERINNKIAALTETALITIGDKSLVDDEGRNIRKGEYRIKMNEIIGKGSTIKRMYGGIGTAGVLTGGIGTGGARDFVSRMDGGAKRMMMEIKDKPDRELKQLYHDLGKGMFQSIKRVLADEMDISMSVKPRKSKVVESIMEAKPKTKRSRKPAVEAVEEQRAIVEEQMVRPVPKIIRRRIVRQNPQGSILKSGNPDGSITAKGEVDFPGQSVPTRAEIIQATSGTGGGMIGGARPKRQASAKMKARGDAVRRLMKEKGMSLGEASKYLKSHPDQI